MRLGREGIDGASENAAAAALRLDSLMERRSRYFSHHYLFVINGSKAIRSAIGSVSRPCRPLTAITALAGV